jgi:hypothetical protein
MSESYFYVLLSLSLYEATQDNLNVNVYKCVSKQSNI